MHKKLHLPKIKHDSARLGRKKALANLAFFLNLATCAISTDIFGVKMTSDDFFDETLQKEQLENLTTWVSKFSQDLRGCSKQANYSGPYERTGFFN